MIRMHENNWNEKNVKKFDGDLSEASIKKQVWPFQLMSNIENLNCWVALKVHASQK